MLLHILLLLTNRSNADRRKKRVEMRVINCPKCNQVSKAQQVKVLVQKKGAMAHQIEVESLQLHCGTCGSQFNAESFVPDESGVLQVKQWDCPKCQQMNPSSSYVCGFCGFRLV